MKTEKHSHAIGIFDSGVGGLTVFDEIVKHLPEYNYIYLGDNARVPYGTRSFETVYKYTLECVSQLYEMGCRLVVIACNTASAKALRTIQQNDLKHFGDGFKVLGVIRPTVEKIGEISKTNHVGLFATNGTVNSQSYVIEINKFFPNVQVFQEACPLWVPLIEQNEFDSEGGRYFIKKHVQSLLSQSEKIDTILLACTHYPIIYQLLRELIPDHIQIVSQGEIVGESLKDYLKRHPEIEQLLQKNNSARFFTTESNLDFDNKAKMFVKFPIKSQIIEL